jgi:hypothetical protein
VLAQGKSIPLPDGLASISRGFATQTPIRELHPQVPTNYFTNLNPAPGSADLIEPRQAHGVPGTEQAIAINGAVNGSLISTNGWTNRKTSSPARAVGQSGIVSGFAGAGSYGGDQLSMAAQAYAASQKQLLTDQASANALYAKIS